MAYTLTIADLRQDLGDSGTPPAFSEEELTTLLAREDGDYKRALLRGLWQLLTQAARLHAYVIGQRREDKQQVFDHLKVLYGMVAGEVAAEAADSRQQVAILGMVAREPQRLHAADVSRLTCPL